jgi:hypothetical protein
MKAYLIGGLMTYVVASMSGEVLAGDKGNGGYSVVCRDDSGFINTAELLDIYEGRVLYKRNYAVDQNSVEDLIEIARIRVSQYAAFQNKLDKELASIEQNLIFVPVGNELEPTDDAFPAIKKKGCKFEQLANYQDSGELLVSQEIYDRLDNVNKAALIVHEAIYSYRRKALGETTSVNTRKLVGQLLAANADELVIERWVSDTLNRPNHKRVCGVEGTLNERIESCSYVQVSGSLGLYLVTRTKEGKEVWFDETNRLLWSDRLPSYMDFETAKRACYKIWPEMGNIPGLKWRLPKVEEYLINSRAYIQILPNMMRYDQSYWFWTSTDRGRSVTIFNGQDGTIGGNPLKRSKSGSVRCVSSI